MLTKRIVWEHTQCFECAAFCGERKTNRIPGNHDWTRQGLPILWLAHQWSTPALHAREARSSSRKRKGLRVKVIFKQARNFRFDLYLHNDELLAESELLFDRTIISVKQKHWISYMLRFKDICRRSVSNAFIWPKKTSIAQITVSAQEGKISSR